MAMAFGRLPTTSEVYRLMFEGVSRRRRNTGYLTWITLELFHPLELVNP
jgi:hypothetical protein